jgi:hypothetical protein
MKMSCETYKQVDRWTVGFAIFGVIGTALNALRNAAAADAWYWVAFWVLCMFGWLTVIPDIWRMHKAAKALFVLTESWSSQIPVGQSGTVQIRIERKPAHTPESAVTDVGHTEDK